MTDFTENQIRTSFLKLLNEKPLKQISVRNIVDDCGISRNTFYYHYTDIPSLIENIIEHDSIELLLKNPKINTVEDCINLVISRILDNKKAVLHIYRSANRDFFEMYHWRICDHVVRAYVSQKLTLTGTKISDRDKSIIITYIKCVVYGVVMGWLDNNLEEDIHIFTHRICELKQGDLEMMIEKCKL